MVKPCIAAVELTICSNLAFNVTSIGVLKARIVPHRVADEGMTLNEFPAETFVTDITPDSNGEIVREITDCKFVINVDAATIGSIVRCG